MYEGTRLSQPTKNCSSRYKSRIYHIQTANIFFTKEQGVKLGDFNVSKTFHEDLHFTKTGTPYYNSP